MSFSTQIIDTVAEQNEVRVCDLLGPRRTNDLVFPRFMAVSLLREHTKSSLPAIGRRLGGRDHSTIMSALRRHRELMERSDYRATYKACEAALTYNPRHHWVRAAPFQSVRDKGHLD